MAVGKNKKLGKKKKGGNRKIVDPFSKKEWYDVKAPSPFKIRQVGKTMVTKTQGTKIAKDGLMGRVFEASVGDLNPNAEDDAFRKFKLKVEEVSGTNCLTNFYGMNLSTDKLRSLVRKWHSLIEAYADVKTTDGYLLRLYVIGFTKRRPNQIRKTSYAQSSQVKNIRKKMIEILQRESSTVDLHELVAKLVAESIGKEIEKATEGIYPLQNVLIRKAVTLRSPKQDLGKLLEIHGGPEVAAATTPVLPAAGATAAAPATADLGKPVERKQAKKPAAADKE